MEIEGTLKLKNDNVASIEEFTKWGNPLVANTLQPFYSSVQGGICS
jgi:hypothetical protein